MSRIWMWLRALTSARRIRAELEEELAFHVEMETEENVRRGISSTRVARVACWPAQGTVESARG